MARAIYHHCPSQYFAPCSSSLNLFTEIELHMHGQEEVARLYCMSKKSETHNLFIDHLDYITIVIYGIIIRFNLALCGTRPIRLQNGAYVKNIVRDD